MQPELEKLKKNFPNFCDGHQYALDVLSGEEIAGEYVRLACKRYLDDYDRTDIYMDFSQAERVVNYCEVFPHIKGELAGQAIRFEAWQKFIVINIFGWLKTVSGKRRFDHAYNEIARKNGKSTFACPIAIYMTVGDREGGAEVYAAATTEDQARIVFDTAKAMARRVKRFLKATNAKLLANAIFHPRSFSYFKPVHSKSESQDGYNTHCAVIDELHAHKDRGLYDVIETSIGARTQPLILIITTAGFNTTGICFELRDYAIKVLEGVFSGDNWFIFICTIDKDDDWNDERNWYKANPSLGKTLSIDYLRNMYNKAIATPASRNNFKTKHLNVWTAAGTQYFSVKHWKNRCIQEDIDLQALRGGTLYLAVDMATRDDIAALVAGIDTGDALYLFPKFYLPESAVEGSSNSQYAGWVEEGYINSIPGEVIDQDIIKNDALELIREFSLAGFAYDPWQASKFANELSNEGIEMFEYRQNVANLSEPTKELGALIKTGGVRHDGNPVLTWMISNVITQEDNKGNIFPKKAKSENKIDGALGAIMIVGLRMNSDGPSVYETRGIITV